MDEQIIKDFQNKLEIYQESFNKIAADFSNKLETLAKDTSSISENVQFLKTMKGIYDQQNKKLETMDSVVSELINRLDTIQEEGIGGKKKKKKK